MKRRAQELLAAGQPAEAKALLVPLCNQHRGDPDVWLLLGLSHNALQSWKDAATCFRTALELRPNDANLQFQLGNALLGLRTYQEAVACYEQCLTKTPGWVEALNNMGRALHLGGAPERAIPRFEQALQLSPNLSTTVVNLALAYLDTGQHWKAIEYLQRALRLKPDWPQVQVMLGKIYMDIGMHDFAVRCFQDAIQQEPRSDQAYLSLGAVYRAQGRTELALNMFRRASQLGGGGVDATVGEATVHEYAGNQEQALQMVRQLLDRGVRTPDLLALFADICKRANACDEALHLITETLKAGTLSRTDRILLLFCLGRLYDDRHDYDRAFESFAEGNRSMQIQFDPAAHRDHIEGIMATFSRASMGHLPRSEHRGDTPVFIIGMPRSGTTLIERILSGHPDVFGAGELPDIAVLVQSLPYRLAVREPFPQSMRDVQPRHLEAMAQEYLAKLRTLAPTARFVTDKMPHNFYYLGLINLLFPNAKVIHCTRSPLDTCLSIYFQYFGPRIPYAYSLSHIAAVYGDYRRLMEHWETALDLNRTTVSYSELVNNPEPTVRKLLSFLGLSWAPECLSFHARQGTVMTASYQQVRRPLYKSSLERWRNYEPHLGELCQALAPWLT